MTIGIGLIGYGGIGRLHALCLRMLPFAYPELPPIRIVAVQTASQESANRAARELGDTVQATTSLEALLANPAVHVVDCCAPTGDHAHIALATLAAGKALFCEKPLAATVAEAQSIVAAAEQYRQPGGMNFHFRQIPAVQEARRICQKGQLGELLSFQMRYYRSSNLRRDRPLTWRFQGPGSGVLVDLGSHMLDLVLDLFGPITNVSARLRTVIPERTDRNGNPVLIDSDDMAWLTLGLANGAHGSIEVSKMVPGAGDDIRFEAYGQGGTLIFDTRDPNGLLLHDGNTERRIATLSRTQPPASLPNPETPAGVLNWHMASLRAFLGAYQEQRQPDPDLRAGLAVDSVIAAAFESANNKSALQSVTG